MVWRFLTANRKTYRWPKEPTERERRAEIIFEVACQPIQRAFRDDRIRDYQRNMVRVADRIADALDEFH